MNLNTIASIAYLIARGTRDLVAITKGPGATLLRLLRKALGRAVNGPINRI